MALQNIKMNDFAYWASTRATSTVFLGSYYDYGPTVGVDKPKREGWMNLFQYWVIDRKTCAVLGKGEIIAENKEDALLAVTLSEDDRKRVASEEITVIINSVGGFEKYKTRVKIVED